MKENNDLRDHCYAELYNGAMEIAGENLTGKKPEITAHRLRALAEIVAELCRRQARLEKAD